MTLCVVSCVAGKQGCAPDACGDLAQYVIEECPHLKLTGLMTIGQRGQTITPNPDFVVSVQRTTVLVCLAHACWMLDRFCAFPANEGLLA